MRLVYDKKTLKIVSIVTQNGGTVTESPSDIGVIEGDVTTIIFRSMEVGVRLDHLQKFLSPSEIQWAIRSSQIIKDSRFGVLLGARIIDQIKNLDGLTVAQRGTLLNKIHLFLTVLQFGDVQAAKAIMNSYTVDTLLTTARKTWVIQQIDAYLA